MTDVSSEVISPRGALHESGCLRCVLCVHESEMCLRMQYELNRFEVVVQLAACLCDSCQPKRPNKYLCASITSVSTSQILNAELE